MLICSATNITQHVRLCASKEITQKKYIKSSIEAVAEELADWDYEHVSDFVKLVMKAYEKHVVEVKTERGQEMLPGIGKSEFNLRHIYYTDINGKPQVFRDIAPGAKGLKYADSSSSSSIEIGKQKHYEEFIIQCLLPHINIK